MKNREHKFYLIDSAILFVISSFLLWEFVYEISNMLGSISCGSANQAMEEFKRVCPVIFTCFITIYMAYYLFAAYQAKDGETRIRIWQVNGIVTIILGLMDALLVLIKIADGRYEKLVEGFPTPLFPLDMLIGSLLIALYGALSIRYSARLKEKPSVLPYINVVNKKGKVKSSLSICTCFIYLIALAGFQACIRGFYVLDFTHGAVFFNIMFWLMYFIPFEMYLVYRYVYIEMPVSKRKENQKKMSLAFLGINVLVLILYLVSVQIYNEAPNLNAFGLLPVDFTAGMNFFLLLFGPVAVLTPLVALLKSVFSK